MSLMIATGSNLGEREKALLLAKNHLKQNFSLIKASRIYLSKATDYIDQPPFLNQVLEFKKPEATPQAVMKSLLEIEKNLGRQRKISKGPRCIDIDLLFFGLDTVETKIVTVPHPRLFTRSFVVRPLKELPYFQILEEHYQFDENFEIDAKPI